MKNNPVHRPIYMSVTNIRCICLSAAIIATGLFSSAFAQVQQPNILLIELDDARFDMFQPNGGPDFFQTPSINRIAEEGVNFKLMGATTSLCVPSRSSIYTGLYAHHHGAYDNGTSPKPGLTYVSGILQDAGYYTGFVGKWLLGKKLPDKPVGFDYWAVTDEDEHLDPPILFNDSTTITYTGHDAVIYTNLALDFLENKVPQGMPWLLMVSHRVPHLPYEPLSAEDSLYQFETIPFPDNFQAYRQDFPSYLYPGHEFEGDSAELDQQIRDYYETCHAAEYSTARLLNYLDSLNIINNTLIIFSSDNGYFLGEHFLGKKSLSYDESLKLPLFVRYPAWFTPGTVIEDEFAANIDFAPTMLEAAGIPDTFNMDGVSLHQLATGQVHRKDFLLENYTENGNNWEAIHSKNYVYIYSYCSSVTEEFFDLTIDSKQNHNLINNTDYADLIELYRMKLDSLRTATGDTIMPDLQNCSLQSEFYIDQDGDGYGNPNQFVRSTYQPGGYVTNADDCNDDTAANGALFYPGATELANQLDDDCDGLIDELSTFYADADGDGFGNAMDTILTVEVPAGYTTDNTDCNDDPDAGGATVYPGAPEVMNGIDDDCNGMIDESLLYLDADQDGYGNPEVYIESTEPVPGYVTDKSDCNDNPNDGGADIHPGVTDFCNGIDDNCDGVTDENAVTATITPNGFVYVCTSTKVTFTANSEPGIIYQWLKDGVPINGATGSSYTTSKQANYQVVEYNSYNCLSTSLITYLGTLSKPAATITPLGDLDICLTGSVKLQANSGSTLSYQWKKGSDLIEGATKKNYTAKATGLYKIIVTKTNGCSKTSDGVKVTKSCKEIPVTGINAETFNIYPNPSGGAISIYFAFDAPAACNAMVTVKTIMGKEIYSEKVDVENGVLFTEINPWKDASNGLYIVEISVSPATNEMDKRQWMKTVVYER